MGRSRARTRKRTKQSAAMRRVWVLKRLKEANLRKQNILQSEVINKENSFAVQIKNELDIEETQIAGLCRKENTENNLLNIQAKIKEEVVEFERDPLGEEECDPLRNENCESFACGPILMNSLLGRALTQETNGKVERQNKTEPGQKLIKILSITTPKGLTKTKQETLMKIDPPLCLKKSLKPDSFRVYRPAPLKLAEQRKKLMEKHQAELVILQKHIKQQLEQMKKRHEKELLQLKLSN